MEDEIEFDSVPKSPPCNIEKAPPQLICVVCTKDLTALDSEVMCVQDKIHKYQIKIKNVSKAKEIHVNKCLDKQESVEGNASFTSLLSDSEDEVDDFIAITTKKAPTFCPICGIDISLLTILQQTKHVNKCCNKQTSNLKINSVQDYSKIPDNLISYCSACGINLSGKSDDFRIKHYKKCHRENNTKFSELKKIKGAKFSQKKITKK